MYILKSIGLFSLFFSLYVHVYTCTKLCALVLLFCVYIYFCPRSFYSRRRITAKFMPSRTIPKKMFIGVYFNFFV